MTKNNVCVGIDYSMSSPAICIHTGLDWHFDNCKFYFVTAKKRCIVPKHNFYPSDYPLYSSQEERFHWLSDWAIQLIVPTASVWMEGYAYASTGIVFDIGENTGLLKHKLWKKLKTEVNVVSPASVKKFATGKGNANKLSMHAQFIADVNIPLDLYFDTKPGLSPIADMIDAYYICKYGFWKQ